MDDSCTDASRREEQLARELAASPVRELTGVVSASGAGAGRSGGQERWTLAFTFDAWRIGTEPVRIEPLTLRRRVTDAELREFQDLIEAETVIKIRARVVENSAVGNLRGKLEEFIQVDSTDSELHEHLAELQKPLICEDARFGTLTFDRCVRWYAGTTRWQGEVVDLHLTADGPEELVPALKVAYELWDSESIWHERVSNYAVEELLPLKNDSWLGDDETELSQEQFRNRMKLQSISVSSEGHFEFWHDDGDLFWGHSIQVSGNLSDGPIAADIPG